MQLVSKQLALSGEKTKTLDMIEQYKFTLSYSL